MLWEIRDRSTGSRPERAPVTHDLNGNLTNDGTFAYTYNPRNQLTLVKQGNQTRGSYIYDGLGRRVSRTVGNSTTKPAYDGWNLAQERASNGSVSGNYLTGLGLDQPFIRAPSSGSARYYLSDGLGSIQPHRHRAHDLHLRALRQDDDRRDRKRQLPRLHWPRERLEGTLSLYNYRARSYAPTLHRFLTEDPIGFSSGDANLYGYVRNAPVTGTDPLGLILSEFGAAIQSTLTFLGNALPDALRFLGDFAYGFFFGFVSAFRQLETFVLVAAGGVFAGGIILSALGFPAALGPAILATVYILSKGTAIATGGAMVWGFLEGSEERAQGAQE